MEKKEITITLSLSDYNHILSGLERTRDYYHFKEATAPTEHDAVMMERIADRYEETADRIRSQKRGQEA